MWTFSSSDCLDLWESGALLHPLDRGLLALGAALPDAPPETLADWTLGKRNAALAKLRCSSFGPVLRGWTACRHCGEKLEVDFDARLLADGPMGEDRGPAEAIVVNGHSFRPLTTRDLAKAARESDARRASMRLLESCRLDAGEPPEWSDEDLEQIGQRLADADPLAETRLSMRCPSCDAQSEETLDVVSFLWREIEARARRLLLEIHTLASAYGWTEAEILSLSDHRRAHYMELVQS
jgi:hypothetical protein